jgi:hypothetical protein
MKKEEQEEKRFVRLERRLMPNVDFDGALQVLGTLEQPCMGEIL